MTDDIPAKIEHNRRALLRLLSSVFAMLGLSSAGTAVSVSPAMRLAILMVLGPAESALRRLIFAVSLGLVIAAPARRAAPGSPLPVGTGGGDGCFALFDRRKRFAELSPPPIRSTGNAPRIHYFDGFDPVYDDTPKAQPDAAVQTASLRARLQSALRALDDIPGQARRLLRVQARRRAAGEPPSRTEPMRPGWPPGYRQRHRHEVDGVLYECEILARRAVAANDTS